MDQKEKLDLLKEILLTDEREFTERISKKIAILEQTLREKEKLSEKVSPIIQDELEKFKSDIPNKLGPVITETLKIEIKNSKDEVVEALYPILGKMIKKYISQEMKVLSEKVNNAARNTFSFAGLKRKLKAKATGVDENELILRDLASAQIEQVFLIEKDSGILLGSFSKKETVDQDMISGMLTAIKAFVEDAFKEGGVDLQSIEYDSYEIHLQNFHKYYIATALRGTFTENAQSELEEYNLDVSQEINKTGLLSSKQELEIMLEQKYNQYHLSKK